MTETIEQTAEETETPRRRRNPFRAGAAGLTRRAAKASRRTRIAIVATLSVLALALAGAGVYLFLQARAHDDVDQAEADALGSARTVVPSLLSYDYHTVDQTLAAAAGQTTGDFRQQFTTLSQQVIAPAAKDQQLVTKATVSAAAVVGGEEDRVTVLLFLNQSTTGKDQKDPKLDGSRVRAVLERVDGHWLVSDLTPV